MGKAADLKKRILGLYDGADSKIQKNERGFQTSALLGLAELATALSDGVVDLADKDALVLPIYEFECLPKNPYPGQDCYLCREGIKRGGMVWYWSKRPRKARTVAFHAKCFDEVRGKLKSNPDLFDKMKQDGIV